MGSDMMFLQKASRCCLEIYTALLKEPICDFARDFLDLVSGSYVHRFTSEIPLHSWPQAPTQSVHPAIRAFARQRYVRMTQFSYNTEFSGLNRSRTLYNHRRIKIELDWDDRFTALCH